MADGQKLPPLIIFKRKTVPKLGIRNDVVVAANENGWMNTSIMKIWREKVWAARRRGAIFQPDSVVILDSFRGHTTTEVKDLFSRNPSMAVIPGGLTCKLQPLDLTVNRAFKARLRMKWEQWMIDGIHDYIRTGKLKQASNSLMCDWIAGAWNDISSECVFNGFRAALNRNVFDDNEVINEIIKMKISK
ncbi:hypothetical protein ENBRE01_3160 [Enteropsectra breve]|nr:hypothetical protein ENBRE01_3160 [Enteropsectra breve]